MLRRPRKMLNLMKRKIDQRERERERERESESETKMKMDRRENEVCS